VAFEGEQAIPLIIDFGVAKALSQSLTDRTLITEQAQMIGTPEYMSPEQAEMTSQDIDTRNDILCCTRDHRSDRSAEGRKRFWSANTRSGKSTVTSVGD